MGDRVSISFRNGKQESVALFNHWDGMEFVDRARAYAAELPRGGLSPLGRLEPGIVMVDFIRHITVGKSRVEDTLYLGRDEEADDNSDNGHHIIDLT